MDIWQNWFFIIPSDYYRAVGRSENLGVSVLFGGHLNPPGWDRVNWSAKIWGCHGTPGIPRDDRPVLSSPSCVICDRQFRHFSPASCLVWTSTLIKLISVFQSNKPAHRIVPMIIKTYFCVFHWSSGTYYEATKLENNLPPFF